MSGEPRNRRVKKRKRDDRKSEGEIIFSRKQSVQEDDESSHGVHITKMGSDDVLLHVQEEHGTGGHWCARIIFFALMAILLSLVGLIILENRGISNIDTPLSESRFSNYFDGWVEEHRAEDHHDAVKASIEEHDEHDEPFEEEDDHSEVDEEEEDDDQEDEEPDDNQHHTNTPGDEDDDNDDDDDDEDNEENDPILARSTQKSSTSSQQKNSAADDDDDEDDEDNEDNDPILRRSTQQSSTSSRQKNSAAEDDDDGTLESEEQSRGDSHAIDNNDKEDDNDADEEDDEDNEDDDPILTRSTQQSAGSSQQKNSATENTDNDDPFDEDDDDDTLESQEQSRVDSHATDNNDKEDDNTAGDEEDDDDDEEDDEDNEDNDPIVTRSTQQSATSSQQKNSAADNTDNDDPFDEDDDDGTFESLENVVDNDAEELKLLQEKARQQAKPPAEKDNDDDQDNAAETAPSWASLLAVKIGVGVALALVARFVLIRKNPNTTDDEPVAATLMKRRLTIANEEVTYDDEEEAPPLSDDEPGYGEELELEEEIEYVEEEEEIEIEIDENGDEVKPSLRNYEPQTFEELSSMYRPKSYAPEPAKDPSNLTTSNVNRIDKFRAEKYGRSIQTTISNEQPTTTKIIQNTPINQTPAVSTVQPPAVPPRLIEPKMKPKSYTPLATIAASSAATVAAAAALSQPLLDTTDKVELNAQQSSSKNLYPVEAEVTTREVTHDLDYQPDEDDIDYDDDDYGEEEIAEEEEEIEDVLDDEDLDDASDVDDTELMSRLEAKYGRLPPTKEYESDEDPDDPTWTQIKPKSTGGGAQAHEEEFDELFERELRRANEEMMRERYSIALHSFTMLSQKYPDQPAAFLGKAKCLDNLSEQQRSNKLLVDALDAYKRYLALSDEITDAQEFRQVAEHCVERMRFMGLHIQAVPIHQQIIARFPEHPAQRNQLAVTYLMVNRLADAKTILQETLQRCPRNGFALVHFGFVLKNFDQDYAAAVHYLQKGIDSQEEGTQDGRFFFNLGDAYQRLGLAEKAYEIYKRGAALKLFPSIYQRSLYNERNLRAQPYWTKEETSYALYLNKLELNWRAIRNEGLSLLSQRGHFVDESENLRDSGDWKQFELYARGHRRHKNCLKAPVTCSIIDEFKAAAYCRRGQVKFSVMHGGTHVFPHCGPTNCRLRSHLGLVVPQGTRLRVANQESNWTEGKFLIFDDSFEHEVWHEGSTLRLVLIVDFWHPDLSEQQRQSLTAI